jgi:uncharacterized protein YndB with AHSA1/START domain
MSATRSATDRKRQTSSPAETTSDREIVIERTFDASPDRVWAAWIDSAQLDAWWGPNGFRNETSSMDFRVGGVWRYVMRGPDGKDWPNWIRYQEIVPLERLAYQHGGDGDEPHFSVTVTFEDQGGRTRVNMRSTFPSAEACAEVKKFGVVEGGRETLARLAGHLPRMADGSAQGAMVLSRLFRAPAHQVFTAWSSPDALARWWGPKGFTLPVCEVDFRPGGAYRMVMRAPDGTDYPFHGSYREIVPDQRIVFVAVLDHAPGAELVTTIHFVEEGGATLVTVCQQVPSQKEAAKGQRQGWSESLEKLGAILSPG